MGDSEDSTRFMSIEHVNQEDFCGVIALTYFSPLNLVKCLAAKICRHVSKLQWQNISYESEKIIVSVAQ